MISLRTLLVMLVVGGAFALSIGHQWQLIERTGTAIPQHDQWQEEPPYLYLPLLGYGVNANSFLHPHGEHRIVLTRLLALGVFLLNGQWDGAMQNTVNAVLNVLILWPLLGLLRTGLPPPLWVLGALGLALLTGSAVCYENALWGFQSQFYFLVLCALLHLRGVLGCAPGSAGWLAGWVAGIAGLGSMSSGWLAPLVATVVLTLRTLFPDSPGATGWRRWWPAVLLAITAVTGLAFALQIRGSSLPWEPALSWRTFQQFLAFPARDFSHTGWLIWSLFVLVTLAFAVRRKLTGSEAFLFGTGGWVLLQVALISLARPGDYAALPNRYLDIAAVGLAVNAAALGVFTLRFWSRPKARYAALLVSIGLAVPWTYWVVTQARASHKIHHEVVEPYMRDLYQEQGERVRAFLLTDDEKFIREVTYPHVPAAIPNLFITLLRNPKVQGILPAEIAPRLGLSFPDNPELNNALPVSVPHTPYEFNQGTAPAPAGSAAQLEALSAPISLPAGFALRLLLAGHFKAGEVELRLESESADVPPVVFTDFSADTQVPVTIQPPASPFRVRMIDRSATGWIAWSRPVSVGPWSHAADQWRASGPTWVRAGWVLLGSALIISLLPTVWRREESSTP